MKERQTPSEANSISTDSSKQAVERRNRGHFYPNLGQDNGNPQNSVHRNGKVGIL
jgi:hypothetical protein